MERISTFNYEAFYLDYLEGNLKEEDVALLFNFLKKHPELEVDLDEFPVLLPENFIVDPMYINSLKQVDIDSDAIHLNNCEAFVIANVEQQLSVEKQNELFLLAKKNARVNELILEYSNIKLVPNSTIVYPNKSELKKSRRIVLWPYIAAAASIVLFVLMYQGLTKNEPPFGEKLIAKNRSTKQKLYKSITDSLPSINTENDQPILNELNDQISPSKEKTTEFSSDNRKNQLNKEEKNNFIEKDKEPQPIEIANSNEGIEDKKDGNSLQENVNQNMFFEPENDVAKIGVIAKSKDNSLIAYNEMKNPIKPITNRLSEFTNTEIDVRTSKATNEKRGGFYLKIGKLEVERTTRR